MVEALAPAGRIEEAMAVGAALVERLRADPAAARSRAQIHIWLAHAAVAATRWPAARAQLDQATSLLPGSDNRDLLAEVMVLRADVAMAADEPLAGPRARRQRAQHPGGGRARRGAVPCAGRSSGAAAAAGLAAAQDAFERALADRGCRGAPLLAAAGAARTRHHRAVQPQRDGAAEPGPPAGGRQQPRRDEHRGRPEPATGRRGRRAWFDLDELARLVRDSPGISERLGLEEVRAKALTFLVESCALRGDAEQTEHYETGALAAAGGCDWIGGSVRCGARAGHAGPAAERSGRCHPRLRAERGDPAGGSERRAGELPRRAAARAGGDRGRACRWDPRGGLRVWD